MQSRNRDTESENKPMDTTGGGGRRAGLERRVSTHTPLHIKQVTGENRLRGSENTQALWALNGKEVQKGVPGHAGPIHTAVRRKRHIVRHPHSRETKNRTLLHCCRYSPRRDEIPQTGHTVISTWLCVGQRYSPPTFDLLLKWLFNKTDFK